MKRYTTKLVSKWIQNLGNLHRERKPKPFPGLAPTRFMFSLVDNKQTFQYLGKPSQAIFNKLRNLATKPVTNENYYMICVEFDKAGIVHYGKNNYQGLNIKTNNLLWQHYHPEVGPDLFPTWLNWKYKIINGVYKII